ncbi:MAG: hypothetical protein ACKO7C_02540 [Bacteroidota bacterium]
MKTFLLLFLATFAAVSCRDRNEYLQPAYFSFMVNINEPSFFDLSVPTGWVYYNGNNVNLIIYRNDLEVFHVYDARSTYNPTDPCNCEVASDNVTIQDPCSGSKWLLSDGFLLEGPATFNLLEYDYDFDLNTGNLYLFSQ